MKDLWPYVQIARVDHWFKNVFMLLGVLLAVFYRPEFLHPSGLARLALALLCTCLVASSNYVLNELLDAPLDRLHPTKKTRPAADGRIKAWIALAEWLALAATGVGLSFTINAPFAIAALLLWVQGAVYNVRPVRSKELPYLDVLSESLNNPLRLLLGWHAFVADRLPPLSLMLAYWMMGAFFMATKRLAEYRQIGDKQVAARYRRSFAHYDEDRLLVSMLFYATASALFAGIFIVRYKLELILSVPVVAGFMAYYLWIGLRPNSPVQHPEKLHREYGLMLYGLVALGVFVLLMFTEIALLYQLFNVERPSFEPLWRIGG